MAENKNKQIDISICIPTYNRAPILARCLEHLLTFSRINFEIIVGDNASTDETEKIVQSFSNKFPVFTYHRHSENIGFARNMDSVLRMARGKYIYILSDDDMVFENALVQMKAILDITPTVVCISGKYLSSAQTKIGMDQTYDDVKVLLFKQGDYVNLVENFLICDGHPFMRREIFQQYCMYNDRSFCLTPLFFKLLSLGDILFLQTPIFQHFRNSDSLTTNMTEHWFIDYVNADIEVALSDIIDSLPPGSTEMMRHKMLQIIYFQAARMAKLSEDYGLMWHFLRRLKAIGGASADCLVKCENAFLLQVVIERICIIVQELGATTVLFQDIPLLQKLTELIQPRMTNITWKGFTSLDQISMEHSAKQVYLLQTYDSNVITEAGLNNVISLIDLLGSLRLTFHQLGVNVDNNGITFPFIDEAGISLMNQPSPGFEGLNAKYAEPDSI